MTNIFAVAQSALDEGIPFDAAVVDLLLADGNASPLIQVLSERGIVAILQKPHTESDLINAITRTPPSSRAASA